MLRRGAGGIEYLRQSLALTRPEFEARRAPGLSINVSPSPADPVGYVLTVANDGPHAYQNLHIDYGALLLNAEHFGLDTTHMSDADARKPGKPIEIGVLSAGQSVQVMRTGYESHDRYDGPHETVLDLQFQLQGRAFATRDRRWIPIFVNLPTARRASALIA